jgi:DNA-directed RNA polymerase subunit RPC12/RpoP
MTRDQIPCPTCRSRDVEPISQIRRRIWDRIARLIGWRLYRCRLCGREFYIADESKELAAAVAAPLRHQR